MSDLMKKNPISKHKGLITSFISRKFSSKNTTNPPPSNEIEPYHFKRDESVNMRRVAMHSVLLDNPNTVESYFRKLAFKQKLKKQKLQEEIKQKKNCNTLLPAFTLNQELKRKWNRIKVRLHMHISFQKTRNEMKLYGIIKNKNNVSGDLVDMGESKRINEIKLNHTLFHSHSPFKSVWSLILALLLLYTAFVTPIQIAFFDEKTKEWEAIDYLMSILFIFDIFVMMNSSYYDHNNQLVQSRKKIISKYLKGWFFLDFIAAFPFEILENDLNDKEIGISMDELTFADLKKLLLLPRIYRLLRLLRLIKMITKTKKSKYMLKFQEAFKLNSGVIKVINFFIICSIAVNFMGCAWFFIAKIRNFEEETWVFQMNLLNEENYILYTYSIYWAIATLCTVGYGDIHAFNSLERSLSIIWMFFGAGFYSYSIGSLSSIITNLDSRKSMSQRKKMIMDEFCKENNLSKELHKKINKAIEYISYKSLFTHEEKNELFRELPSSLKFEIANISHHTLLGKIPFFQNKDEIFIAEFVLFLTPIRMNFGEIIYEKGQFPHSVYFIIGGNISYVAGSQSMTYKTMVSGGYFGEIEIFKEIARLNTVRASNLCELMTIKREEFLKVISSFPDVEKELIEISEEKHKRILENFNNVQYLLPLSKNSTFWIKKRNREAIFIKSSINPFIEPIKKYDKTYLCFIKLIRTFISFFYKPKKKILPKNKFLLNEISKNKDSRGRNLTIFEFLENNYSHKEDWKIEFERSLSLSKLKTKLDSTKKIIMNINNDNNLQIENKNNNEIIENDEKKKNSMKGILKISNFQNNLKKITENLKNPKEILLRSKSVIIENLGIEKKKKSKSCIIIFEKKNNKKKKKFKFHQSLLVDYENPKNITKDLIKKIDEKWTELEDSADSAINKLKELNLKIMCLKKK